MRPPGTFSREIENAAAVAMNSVSAPTARRDQRRIPELDVEVAQEIMLLLEHDLEIVERRMVRPQLARERVLLRGDREQEHVIDRDHRPQEDGNADQQEPRFGRDFAPRKLSYAGELHRDNRFIMKYTSGRTNGIAQTMDAIASESWSSRR
ncbi:hypothetical protein ACVIIV_000434 [Bradyrhizobium sp. USDA 4354]